MKIIQIAAAAAGDIDYVEENLYALTDDGEVLEYTRGMEGVRTPGWIKLSNELSKPVE